MQDLDVLLGITFLEWLDMRVHTRRKVNIKNARAYIDEYSKKISRTEADTLYAMVKGGGFLLYPTKLATGMDVGFVVASVDQGKVYKHLQFVEQQLPDGYSFMTLSRTFMAKKNLALAEEAGVHILNNRAHYLS
ncbi:MAG: hypothetical protein V1725_07575 [archaeon]